MIESFGASDQGCVRGNNEDYYLIVPSLGLYVVADGMGGAQAGARRTPPANLPRMEFPRKRERWCPLSRKLIAG
jgi:hypothetical protein